jgi:hypothetical protein
MKCIKKISTGVVARVKDHVATKFVAEGKWEYMGKEPYKDITKPNWRVKK